MCPKFLRAYAPKKYRVINFNLNVMFFWALNIRFSNSYSKFNKMLDTAQLNYA